MADPIDLTEGLGRRELVEVRRRFLEVTRQRLERIQEDLRPGQREFLRLLPLLCHVNHPMLPGFVTSETPAGIPGFEPDAGQLDLARKHGRTFQYRPRPQRSPPVQALYLMGSMGTIGHSRGSDLDLWLCHDPALSKEGLSALTEKVRRLERWAEELGLEAHFFLMDAEAFRHGKVQRLSGESSGSTQHGLLLEEFYRSGLLLAGRFPLWWLVPPDQEGDYAGVTRELEQKRFIDPGEYLDFGGLANVPAAEFFGAGLWQLYKGVHSPYKSVLKILLMEAYALDYPRPDWVALQIKRAVYEGALEPDRLDSYLLMYRHVETYLRRRAQAERLELARRCLYFKVGERLSQRQGEPGWRARRMAELTRVWGWGQAQLLDLDTRPGWKADRVSRERNQLVRELTRSYRLLTDFATGHGNEMRVDPRELSLLGRKLYTTLEHRPGKLDRVNPGISDDLAEEELSLHFETSARGGGWTLYRGRVDEEERGVQEPLRVTQGLAEQLGWCQVNGICTPGTRYHLFPRDCPMQDRELRALADALRTGLPAGGELDTDLERLGRPPFPVRLLVFLNLGADPQAQLSKDGMRLVSGRADPLSFGSARRCQLLGLELLVQTSWGELVTQSHRDREGLLDALCFYLELSRHAPADAPPTELRVEGFSSADAAQLSRRVLQVLTQARRFFDQHPNGRYVVGLGTALYRVESGERGFGWTRHDGPEDLVEALGQPRVRFSPLVFDPQTLEDSPLPALFRHGRAGEQQLFFHVASQRTRIFVLDESGALFQQTFPVADPRFLLIQQHRFLESLARLRRMSGMAEEAATLITGPRFYRLDRGGDGAWQAQRVRLPLPGIADDYLELRLVAATSGPRTRVLSLICGDREFSALTLREDLFTAVARHILGFRGAGADYPIYLTAVELIRDRYGIPPGGVELLDLKRRVEQRLNEAMHALRQPAEAPA